MNNRKKMIVTGADGQLGQTLIKYLLNTQPHLEVIGTIRYKSVANTSYVFDTTKVNIEPMDLNDVHSIEGLILKHRPAYFVNTAANAYVGDSWNQPVIHFQQNCLAVLHQLEAIRKHSPTTRYINMGTSEEFAVCGKSDPQNENTKIAPRSPYGCSKAAARYLVDVYRESYGLYAIQPWCFNFEGPLRGAKYLTKKCTLAVARIARALKDGKPFEPLEVGNIYSFRSWQAAEDVADGIWRTLNQEKYRGLDVCGWERDEDIDNPDFIKYLSPQLKPYVFSSQDTHDVKSFITQSFKVAGINGQWMKLTDDPADEVFAILGTPKDSTSEGHFSTEVPVHIGVRINPEFYRPLDVTYLHGDSTLARTELGWSPQVSFDQLVERMVRHDLAEVGL